MYLQNRRVPGCAEGELQTNAVPRFGGTREEHNSMRLRMKRIYGGVDAKKKCKLLMQRK